MENIDQKQTNLTAKLSGKRSTLTQNRYTDRCLILALRSHLRLQLKVQSGFWLVLPEKSNSGFPVVNPAYEAAITLLQHQRLLLL